MTSAPSSDDDMIILGNNTDLDDAQNTTVGSRDRDRGRDRGVALRVQGKISEAKYEQLKGGNRLLRDNTTSAPSSNDNTDDDMIILGNNTDLDDAQNTTVGSRARARGRDRGVALRVQGKISEAKYEQLKGGNRLLRDNTTSA